MSGRKIVFGSEMVSGSTEHGIADGFRKLGWDVHLCNPHRFLLQGQSAFGKACAAMQLPVAVRRYNRELAALAARLKPEVMFTVKGNYISRETLDAVRKQGVCTVNYYPDFRFGYKSVNRESFKGYSLFVTTKSFQVPCLAEELGQDRVRFLHHGYVSAVHYPPSSPHRDENIDILYVGNHSQEKERWLTQVSDRFPDLLMRIYGNRWKECVKQGSLMQRIAGYAITGADYAGAVFNAKINLAVHMGCADVTNWEDLVSTRTFEIPACKGFMLHIDNPEVRELFSVGSEIDVFRDLDELCDRIEFYLPKVDLRREMAEKAYRRCVPAYSYDERARALAEWITEHRP
ncbi:MAG TPA: glycosyltransferase [Methylococcaceae bacterium]|nr:glycosyltransferase [Methylococcaceae bacterium]